MTKSQINQSEMIDTIKLLIYKEKETLFEKIDFNDDSIFLEPLLFAYFNSKKGNLFSANVLEEIMQGYYIQRQKTVIDGLYNNESIAYLPNIGYFKNEDQPFESLAYIPDSGIEVLKYRVPLLDSIFRTVSGNEIPSQDIRIDKQLFDKNIDLLNNAFKLIKETTPEQYQLIEKCCKKCVLFKTAPEITNSFATINAHGIAFFNVYQDDYDEVFFIDDIAHQTGHIIMTTLCYIRKSIFKIDENMMIGVVLKDNTEYRSLYILYHALYTYYTTLLCLTNCIKANCLEECKSIEAIGRVGFYLKKCQSDIQRFEKIATAFNGIENILEPEGIDIYKMIKNKYLEIVTQFPSANNLDYSNQAYNYVHSYFLKINAI